jgi:DnaJ-class molecular chaperone
MNLVFRPHAQGSTFHQRKAERTVAFEKIKGKKLIICGACSGSGYYDHNGSPKCGYCNGTGKVREE